MRLTVSTFAFAFVLISSMGAVAGMDHKTHQGGIAHEEVVDGVKATFRLTSIADELKGKGIAVPKDMKETHHLAAVFTDVGSTSPLSKGLVAVRVQGPGSTGEPKELVGMDGHFGADFDLSKPGKYGIMSRFVLEDGKKRQVRFWYKVK